MVLHGIAGLLAVAMLVVPVAAESQGIADSLGQLKTAGSVKPGDAIFVTDVDGRRTRARIVDLSAASLTLKEGQRTRTLTAAEVTRIERRDSVENGIWLGAAAGVGMLTAVCKIDPDPEHCVYYVYYFGLPAIGGGAVIGALADAAIHRTLYAASAQAGSPRVTASPSVSKTHLGALVAVQW